ncbi:MAG: flagellar hook-basal body complex protein FliE [Clostridium sp.]
MRINSFTPSEELFINSFNENNKNVGEKSNTSFGDILKAGIDSVNEKQIESEKATEMLVKGEDIEIHEVMLAAEEAKIALNMAVEVRNKLVEAYQEINRMQL